MVAVSALSVAIYGASQALGHVLNWQQHKKDGTFGEQQELLAEIRREESRRAYEYLMARDAQQAQQAFERAQYESELRIEESVLDHERSKELAQVKADIFTAVQVERERRDRDLANSPFDYTLDEARERVGERTRNGAVPVLLIAPFRYDDPGYRGPNFDIALRQAWRSAPWAGDMNVFGGLISRPLNGSDVDVQTIRMALADMPVVLVHGQVQANVRAWIQVAAWNLGDASGTRVIELDLPPMMLPASADGAQRRLEFEDSAAGAACLVAAAYAEWFHILTYGRAPRLHRLLPPDRDMERRLMAANGATLYQACVSRGLASQARARIVQAIVLAEGGLVDRAVDLVRPTLDERGLPVAEVALIAQLLGQLAAGPVGDRLGQEIERMRRYVLRLQLGMGDME